jgi:hypothetical protein
VRRIPNRGRQQRPRRGPHRRALAGEPRASLYRLVLACSPWVVLLSLCLLPRPASAQYTRDEAARAKIDSTLREEYSQMRYDRAEASLLNVIVTCEDACSPALLARAWMYVGIVRGDGQQDQAAARQAFDNAVSQDRGVRLDAALASKETAATFEAARRGTLERGNNRPLIGAPSGARPQPSRAQAPAAPPASARAERDGLVCTPSEHEVQSRRPIPFACRADAETERVSLRYREHPEAPWQTLELERSESSYRALLPCEMTMNSGRLQYFIVATDASGDPLDTIGSKGSPVELVLNPNSQVTPAFPGEAPPDRCAEQVLCPPEFPGCDDPGSEAPARGVGPRRLYDWLTLGIAADVGFVGGSDVCTSSNSDYDCFTSGSETPFPSALPSGVAARPGEVGDGYPGTDLASGVGVGTLRVLFGYDRVVSDRVSLGGRLGYAFGGAPKTLDGESFLPVHIEARLAYWPEGRWAVGLRPYLAFGGGFAEVDLEKSKVAVRDCTEEATRPLFLDCIAAANAYAPENDPDLPTRELDLYRKLGDAFVSAGAGVEWPLGDRAALQVNLNALLMLPSVGLVLQPSIGIAYGL